MQKEGKCSTNLTRICQTRRKQAPQYAKTYRKYFRLSDMAIKTCHLASFPIGVHLTSLNEGPSQNLGSEIFRKFMLGLCELQLMKHSISGTENYSLGEIQCFYSEN